MKLDVCWWDLGDSTVNIETLQKTVDARTLASWDLVPGLALKVWFSNPEQQCWGAAMLWDDAAPPRATLPPNLAQLAIGHSPAGRIEVTVEACAGRLASLLSHPNSSRDARSVRRAMSYVLVDAFARAPLQGNPVAVFFGAEGLPDELLQKIAREMNLSECTFVLPARQGSDARVRIFTPVNELPFAGHPLLGTALALAAQERRQLRLETAQAVVEFEIEHASSELAYVKMTQPIPVWEPYEQAPTLLAGLGLTGSVLPIEAYRNGPRHVLVACSDVAALSALRPDLRSLATLEDMAAICFAPSADGWRSRMFSPAYGVAEDAATGSSAGPLAIHLARHGRVPYGAYVDILQGVEMGRPSAMRALAHGEGERVDSVEVSGHAVVIGHGTLRV